MELFLNIDLTTLHSKNKQFLAVGSLQCTTALCDIERNVKKKSKEKQVLKLY